MDLLIITYCFWLCSHIIRQPDKLNTCIDQNSCRGKRDGVLYDIFTVIYTHKCSIHVMQGAKHTHILIDQL